MGRLSRAHHAGWLALATLLGACHDPAPAALPATSLLVRYSLDARGVRPSVADLEAVRADPAAVDGYLDTYLADARFGDQVRSFLAPEWLTRADEADIADADYALADEGLEMRQFRQRTINPGRGDLEQITPFHRIVNVQQVADNRAQYLKIAHRDTAAGLIHE